MINNAIFTSSLLFRLPLLFAKPLLRQLLSAGGADLHLHVGERAAVCQFLCNRYRPSVGPGRRRLQTSKATQRIENIIQFDPT